MAIILKGLDNYLTESLGGGFNQGFNKGLIARLQEMMRENEKQTTISAQKDLMAFQNLIAQENYRLAENMSKKLQNPLFNQGYGKNPQPQWGRGLMAEIINNGGGFTIPRETLRSIMKKP